MVGLWQLLLLSLSLFGPAAAAQGSNSTAPATVASPLCNTSNSSAAASRFNITLPPLSAPVTAALDRAAQASTGPLKGDITASR